MRYLFLSFILLSTAANAQVKFEAGLEGSLDGGRYYPTPAFFDKRPLLFINPAIMAGINISNKLSIHAGFGRTTKAERFNNPLAGATSSVASVNHARDKYRYVTVPVNASYNFLKKDSKWSTGITGLLDYSLFYQVDFDSPYQGYTEEYYPSGRREVFSPAVVSVGGGAFAGYNVTKHLIASANLHYKTDLTMLYKPSSFNRSYTSLGCGFSAMYRF